MHLSLLSALLLLSLMAAAATAAEPAASRAALDRNAKAIAAVLPAGWEVRVEIDTLWIESKQTVEMNSNAANPPGGPQPKLMRRPTLSLHAVAAVAQKELDALNKKNADRGMALQMLAAEMKDLSNNAMPMGDQGGYRATTPDQQARLDAYVAVVRALPMLDTPTLFAPDAAFLWGFPNATPVDVAVRAQMEHVRTKIETLFADKPVK